MTHRCPGTLGVHYPSDLVDAEKLACPRHWRMVPPAVQRAVYAAWDRGAGAGTTEHSAAITKAITYMRPQPEDGGQADE